MLKKVRSYVLFAVFATVAYLSNPVQSFAAVDLSSISIDTTSYDALLGIILVGIFAIWIGRKLIKTGNKS